VYVTPCNLNFFIKNFNASLATWYPRGGPNTEAMSVVVRCSTLRSGRSAPCTIYGLWLFVAGCEKQMSSMLFFHVTFVSSSLLGFDRSRSCIDPDAPSSNGGAYHQRRAWKRYGRYGMNESEVPSPASTLSFPIEGSPPS